jgi:DNA-binding IclR family transcriptional regulator
MTATISDAVQHDASESVQASIGGTASVVRALQLLDVFTGDHSTLGVSDISRRAGIPTSTVHRLLSHLVKGNLVTKVGSNYSLSVRLFELGNQVVHSQAQGLKETAAPFLGELFGNTGLTTHLAVLEGPEIVMIDKVVGLRSYPSRTVIGGRYPTACTALGKAMLAFESPEVIRNVAAVGIPRRTRHSLSTAAALIAQLAEVRSTRLAYDREEASLGQVCVASPIVIDGKAVAAIGLSGPAQGSDVTTHGALLVRATAQLTRKLHS